MRKFCGMVGVLQLVVVSIFIFSPSLHAQSAATSRRLVTAPVEMTQVELSAEEAALIPEALRAVPLFAPDTLPFSGTFYSLQYTNYPPLPGNILGLPCWSMGDGMFLLNDVSVDYQALREQAAAEAALTELASPKSAARNSMMALNLASSYAYGNPVYLTNLVVSSGGYQPMSVSFSITGGTNFVPYDILMSTNVAEPVANWNWLGIGYTSNNYSFSNQSTNMAFYILAKPAKTMTVGFGNDSVAQCDVPFGLTNALQVAGGGGQSLALLNNGTMVAWGQNFAGEGVVPTNLTGVAMIAAGWFHNVALLTNGTVTAWGFNAPSIGYTLTNVPPDLTNVTVISAQAVHSLALRSNGTVVAWGYNTSAGETNVPSGLSNVVAIAAGYQFNLAVKTNDNGTVVAWGDNTAGQCNVPAGLSNVVDVAAGTFHSLALLKNGTVVAWGDNFHGETNVPANATNIVAIAAGGDPDIDTAYSLALRGDGTVIAWGDNEAADPVGGLNNVIAIAAGADHALAVRTGPRTPVITLEPTDQYQVQGSNATFTARGAGLYGVTYQWQTNGMNQSGATNAALVITNVQTAQLGSYAVVVGNEVGSLVSSAANLYFVTPPTIVSQTTPANQVGTYQSNLTLNVVATAPGQTNGFPLSYQWQFNGANIPGATAASYTFNVTGSSVGMYSVLVSNAAGSTNAVWSVTTYYSGGLLITQPADQYQIAGGNVTFTGGGVSSNAVMFQWSFNGTNIAGATNASLTLTNVQAAQEGSYHFVASDGVTNCTSSNAYFYLVTAPTITSQTTPTNRVLYYQGSLTFNVTAAAAGQSNGFPLHYQWQFGGTNIVGANTTSYTTSFPASTNAVGNYSVVVTNAAGSVTSVVWQVTFSYATLGYYMATNSVSYANGYSGSSSDQLELSGWSFVEFTGANMVFLTNAVWSTNFWLKGVQGLSATPIGISNNIGGQYLLTMVSPRHYIQATHVNLPPGPIAFLDTNNVIYWRTHVQRVDVANDTSVGILNADLPASVGYLSVMPTNFSNYLPTDSSSYVQGIGMNQDMRVFGQPMTFGNPFVNWSSTAAVPFGLGTNWNVAIRFGDSSDPERLLIGNQLVLVTQHFQAISGPNLALQFAAINQQMHYLSTNNSVGTDYQLTQFPLTNWPSIR